MSNGFKAKRSNKHWLGQGIYFFADISTALNNIDMLTHKDAIKTIGVEIVVSPAQYLDLDNPDNLNAFRRYYQSKISEFETSGVKFNIQKTDKKTASLIYRCLIMDLYKDEKNFAVISKTFAKDQPPYAEKINNIKWFGLPFLEKYICVRDNTYIIKKTIIEEEWVV